MTSVMFTACGGDDDDNQGGNDNPTMNNLDSRFVGTWWDGDPRRPVGFIFEGNGKYTYDEVEHSSEQLFSTSIVTYGTWSTKDNYITIIRDKDQKKEQFRYEFTNDGHLYLYEQYSDREYLEYNLIRM